LKKYPLELGLNIYLEESRKTSKQQISMLIYFKLFDYQRGVLLLEKLYHKVLNQN
jgi:hypothetical protein